MSAGYLPEAAFARRKDLANFDRRLTKDEVLTCWVNASDKERALMQRQLDVLHPQYLHEDWRGELVFPSEGGV